MTQEEQILEDNWLIATFMGLSASVDSGRVYFKITDNFLELVNYSKSKTFNGFIRDKELKFHSSYDWLMPVLKTITDLNPEKGRTWFEFEISTRCHCKIYSNNNEEWKNNGGTTLDAIYKSVIKFINWHTLKYYEIPKGNETVIHNKISTEIK